MAESNLSSESDVSAAWKTYQALLRSGKSARQLGFKSNDGEVSRFLARFELASRYRHSHFERYSAATAGAYSALIGLLLAWSSFEQLARVCGWVQGGDRLDTAAMGRLFDGHAKPLTSRRSAALAPVYLYLAERATSAAIRSALNNASKGHPIAPDKLIRALRNAFVHGQLTAHTGGAMPRNLAPACSTLTEHLLVVQASHFRKLIEAATER